MTRVGDFLSSRRPTPPAGLASRLQLDECPGTVDEQLTSAGLARLAEAQERLGRVRESAFRLLEADALLTYACEAALESEDPRTALQRVLAAVGR